MAWLIAGNVCGKQKRSLAIEDLESVLNKTSPSRQIGDQWEKPLWSFKALQFAA